MAGNKALSNAMKAKEDEFYTQLSDIENELRHYREHFEGKTILLNCDDPYESNFFKYFAMNFNRLGLKKLISTCYKGSPVAQTQLFLFDDYEDEDKGEQPHKIEITEVIDNNEDGKIDLSDVEYLLQNDKNVLTPLEGDGDFRSPECVALLDEADIVITNPPFSLFREYVAQLVEHDKKFIIIGSQNAITYKEVFPLLKEDKIWLGYGFKGGNAFFKVPNGNEERFAKGVYNPETGLVKFRNCCWFTNLDIKKRHEPFLMVEHYSPDKYPKYDNYDAIEVGKVADIPLDYEEGYLVPIEYKQRLIDAGFDLGSDRMDENGNECVCVRERGTISLRRLFPRSRYITRAA